MLKLVIGNKNYSSWSMRAWMLLHFAGEPFEEIPIALYQPGSREKIRALGGETGLVPVLIAENTPIWDTLAITEYLYERHPSVWPADPGKRARARSYAGEIHSGLNALRAAMPCNTRARNRVAARGPQVEDEIARVAEIWRRSAGEWLFGSFCACDIMFAPVAARFRTYGVAFHGAARAYQTRLLEHPLAVAWCATAAEEPMQIGQFELPSRI